MNALKHAGSRQRAVRFGKARTQRGFTLIELMIAVAILAIVMGIAIPSYTQYVIESGRADGKAELYRVAQQLERCYTRFSSYVDDDCSANDSNTSEKEKYIVTITERTATTFSLTATPQGGQANDSDCMALTLNHLGQRGSATDNNDECW